MDDFMNLWTSFSDPFIGSLWNLTSMSEHWNDQKWSEHQQGLQNQFANSQREAIQQFQQGEREASQNWQKWMWDNQNAYNAPVQQMQRMAAAGINPNSAAGLVAGQQVNSSVPGPTAQSGASVPAGSAPSNSSFAPFGSNFASVVEAQAASRLSQSQARLNDSLADKTEEETKGLVIDNGFKPFEKNMDLAIAREKIKVMVSEGKLNDIQGQNLINTFEVLKGKSVAEIDELNAMAKYYNEQFLQSRQQIELLREQIKTEQQKRETLAADEYEAYMNGQAHNSIKLLNGKQGDLAEANKELSELEADDKRKQNEYREELRKKGINPDHPQMKDNVFVAALKSNGTVEDIKTAISFAKAGWSIISNYVDQDRLKLNQSGRQNTWQIRYGKRK